MNMNSGTWGSNGFHGELIDASIIDKWKKLIKESEEIQIKVYHDLLRKKFGFIPKHWMIIFPKKVKHFIPTSLKDNIKFTGMVEDAYLLNTDKMHGPFEKIDFIK